MPTEAPAPEAKPTDPGSAIKAPASKTPAYDALKPKQREWVDRYFVMGRNATAVSRSMGYKAPEKHGWRMSKNVHVQAAIRERLDALEIEASDVLYRIEQRARASGEDFLSFETVERRPLVSVPLTEAVAYLDAEIERADESPVPASTKAAVAHLSRIAEMRRRRAELDARMSADPDGEATTLIPGPPEAVLVARFDLARMREAGKLHLVRSVTKNADGSQKVELHDAAKADELLGKHLGLFTDRLDVTSGGEPLREVRVEIVPPRQRGG